MNEKWVSTIVVAFLLAPLSAMGQNTFELIQDGVNNSLQTPVPKGPTSIPQTLTFFLNKDGSNDRGIYFQALKDPLRVTYSFDDQSYVDVPGHVTGMTFGAGSGAADGNVKAVPVLNNKYMLADSSRRFFTSHPDGPKGQGINMFTNPGLQIFLSTKPLLATKTPTSDTIRHYYGKLRIYFSRPVKDPVLSFVGLGATTNFSGKVLGFSTELELLSAESMMTKLSGTREMLIDKTGKKLLHSPSVISGTCGLGAACGSVLIRGDHITSLIFALYLRSDGGPGVWGTESVTNAGDAWHLIVSLPEQ